MGRIHGLMRALLSVSDKTGLVPFAAALVRPGVGTGVDGGHRQGPGCRRPARHRHFRRHRVSRNDGRAGQDPAPESPRRHPGAPPSRRTTSRRCARTASATVDLVVVNLYPFAKAAARPDIAFDDLVEEIDIGGPSLRAGRREELPRRARRRGSGRLRRGAGRLGLRRADPRLALRFDLARRAFAHTAAYDQTIAATLLEFNVQDDGRFVREANGRGRAAAGMLGAHPDEDPRPPLRREPPSARRVVPRGRRAASVAPSVHQGKELSFTNLLDLDAAARIALEFDEPAAVVIKHTNPCGVAIGGDAGRGVRAAPATPIRCRRLAASSA